MILCVAGAMYLMFSTLLALFIGKLIALGQES